MNLIKTTCILLVVCTFALGSCKKASKGNENTPTSPFMSLKVNGAAQNTTAPNALYTPALKTLIISGGFGDQSLTITLENAATGTFSISSANQLFFDYLTSTNPTPSTAYNGTAGSLTVTSITNDSVSGTFQFTAVNANVAVLNITEGKFTAKITNAN